MNIDPLARWYRWIEYAVYGRALERRRFAYLDRLAAARRVLILGEGDGRALERLMVAAPRASFDVVELGAGMIALARRRVGDREGRVRFFQQDALTGALPDAGYDAVVTLFFLDCFDEAELRIVVGTVRAVLTAGAFWLVSDFAVPESGWRRWHARAVIRIMYEFFGVTTGLRVRKLPPIAKVLREAGLELVTSSGERAGLIRSEMWQFPS